MKSLKDRLDALDQLDTPDVWQRARSLALDRTPEPAPPRHRSGRLTAGVVGVAVFIAAALFSWRALQPTPSTPTAAVSSPGAMLWPDRTAEQLAATQAQVAAGNHDYDWRSDPTHVATAFAEDVLGWGTPSSGGGEIRYAVALDPTTTPSDSSAVVTLAQMAIPCPSPPPGEVGTCPPPFDEERLVLQRSEATDGTSVWTVTEARASGFELDMQAGDQVHNGDPISGHVSFPSTAEALTDYVAQYGFFVDGGGDCSGGTIDGIKPIEDGDFSFPVSVGPAGWAADRCDPAPTGFAFTVSGSVPPCQDNVYGCPVFGLVDGDLKTNHEPLYGLTALPMSLTLGATPTPTQQGPAPSPAVAASDRDMLVNVRDDSDGSSDVYMASPGGKVLPVLTGGTDYDAVWSPDGTKIAFVRVDRNGPCSDSNIYIANADGSRATQLTGDPADLRCEAPSASPGTNVIVSVGVNDDEPAWSPDGTKIAWRTNCADGRSGIGTMNADGTDQTCIGPDGNSGEPRWSPDGHVLAFDSDAGLPADAFGTDIWTMRPDGSHLVRVTNDGGGNIVQDWSPDGSTLLFQRSVDHSDYSWDLWTIALADGERRQLTDWPGMDVSAIYSPDGAKIAFASDRFGDENTVSQGTDAGHAKEGLDVYVLSLADGSIVRATSFAPHVAWPSDW